MYYLIKICYNICTKGDNNKNLERKIYGKENRL